ncbi:hypothetical protein ACQW5G_04180 [Fructilactobacillus sp. Tb1]|uniref:hypothetical protein n=1 Tax=Fructilactobacillus sp. Tb1 TaxID=3422304 RepID=UPI003D26A510
MANRKFISAKILEKEIAVFGTNPEENKDVTDFRVAVALGNANADYLDPKKLSKSSLGNIYSIWLMTYINMPGLENLSDKASESLINEYDFRDDMDDSVDHHNFAKYLNGELSIDEIKEQLNNLK